MSNSYDINSFDFIVSDTHFNHNNIVKYSMRPGFNPRGSVHDYDKHNDLMLINWATTVAPKEKILHLGDIAMGKKDDFAIVAGQLSGDKYLILGNHDKWGTKFYEDLGFTVIDPFYVQYEGWDILFSHYPKERLDSREANVHGHIHNNPCDNLTRRHKNVSVEVMAYTPQPFSKIVESVAYNAKNASDMNFRPSYTNKAVK